ncbi:hypothetical protein VTN00DRAFT_2304 [Thermoascus crustaceus]|uniref:uncharacterized protein n=1 Tax=Thermoascus crustaceus TaxID=5088 RepID=UPI0037446EAA
MPLVRKRRAEPDPEPEPEESASASDDASEEAAAEPASRRRRRIEEDSDDEDSASDDEETHAPSSTDVMVKKLVRLALASEYARQPIRRTDISAKVLGEQGARQFKTVFEEAQKALRVRFGMEMVELPGRERVTIRERRAAQRTEKPSSASTSNKSWILTSTLPREYRTPTILPPTKAPSSFTESSYTALYTFLIAVITLNGGTIPEQKLDRYLKRTNTDTYTPVDRTDRLIQRLIKDGYLVRNREMDGGEEVIEYMVGPRGKVEVGEKGVAGLVREVYGRPDPASLAAAGGGGGTQNGRTAEQQEEMEEFERRLERSIGTRRRRAAEVDGNGDQQAGDGGDDGDAAESGNRRSTGRRARRRGGEEEDND